VCAENEKCVRCLREIGQELATHGRSPVETVTDPPDADEVTRDGRFVLDLLAERDDVVVNYAIGDENARTPDFVQETVSCEHPAPTTYERSEELELSRRRFQAFALAAQLEAGQVELTRTEAVNILRPFRRGTAQAG
jgi:hypothetical protein